MFLEMLFVSLNTTVEGPLRHEGTDNVSTVHKK